MGEVSLEDRLLDDVEDALHELDHLRERWANRITVNNLILSKRYVENKLKLIVLWRSVGVGKQYRAIIQRESEPGAFHPCVDDLRRSRDRTCSLEPFASVGISHKPERLKGDAQTDVSATYRYERLVFVQNVESVEAPESVVPSLVRFQVLDNPSCLGAGPFYVLSKSGFEFFFRHSRMTK